MACAGGPTAASTAPASTTGTPPSAEPTTFPRCRMTGSGGFTHTPRSQMREPLQSTSLRQPSGASGRGQLMLSRGRRRRTRTGCSVVVFVSAESDAFALGLAAAAAGGGAALTGVATASLAFLALLALARLLVIAT